MLLGDLDTPNLIMGGDFNCCLDPDKDRFSKCDDTGLYSPACSRARNRLKHFAEEQAISDVWRLLHPEAESYTYRRPAYSSRFDLWLISDHLTELASESGIYPAALSDHSLSLTIQTIPNVRGPRIWKFDNSLLLDSAFILAMNNLLREYRPDENIVSPQVQWDLLKYEIRKFSIDFTRKTGSQLKRRIDTLTKELRELEESNPSKCPNREEAYRSIKRELADLELPRANKIIFRARANWAQQGERPNKFFLSLEKRRARTNTLNQIMTKDGRLTSDPREILDVARSFYEDLYSADLQEAPPVDDFDWQSLDIPKVSDIHLNRLEEAYSEKELHQALQRMHKGKTPGSDGLSVDFYLKFWDLIKGPLLDSLGYGIQVGHLSMEQKRGIITLIPKKGVDRRQIHNWRPISLLNTDNKILTKAMSIRLQPVLNEILHGDQTGFLPKRYVGENLRTIQDVIYFSNASNSSVSLLALDFYKAFDSIRWDFLFRALLEFGFGENFIDGVKAIFGNIESCTSNAGFTSRYFSPGCDVRQGCCVAPYLFLIAVEVLNIRIRQSPSIKGVSIGDEVVVISQFADDMTVFVRDEASMRALLGVIDSFGAVSGLRINRDKSHLLPLSPPPATGVPPVGLRVVDRVKILGLWFAPDRSIHEHYEWNYKEVLCKMRCICSSWQNRHLSIKDKIAVVNFLVVSLLHFVAANSELPPRVLHELKKVIMHFLWNGGSPKIAYSTLVQSVDERWPKTC